MVFIGVDPVRQMGYEPRVQWFVIILQFNDHHFLIKKSPFYGADQFWPNTLMQKSGVFSGFMPPADLIASLSREESCENRRKSPVESTKMFWTFAVVYVVVFVDSRPLVRAFLTNVSAADVGL